MIGWSIVGTWLLGIAVVGLLGARRIGIDTQTGSGVELAAAVAMVRRAALTVESAWNTNYHLECLHVDKVSGRVPLTPYALFIAGCWVALTAVLWPVALPLLFAFHRGEAHAVTVHRLRAQLAEQDALIEKIRSEEGWS